VVVRMFKMNNLTVVVKQSNLTKESADAICRRSGISPPIRDL